MSKNISYKDYRNTYLNFASLLIDTSISLDTLEEIIYWFNSEYINDEDIDKISNSNYINEDIKSSDYLQKAIEEIKNYNINSYYKGQTPIKLSDAVIIDEQKEVILYIEKLLSEIRNLPQDDAINSYVELKDIILHKNLEGYKSLNYKQQHLIEKIDLPVANNLFDYRNNAKQYKIVQ